MPIAGPSNDATRMTHGSIRPAHNAASTVTPGTRGRARGSARGADNSVFLRFASGKGLAIPFTRHGSRRLSTGSSDAFAVRSGTRRTGSCRRGGLLAAHELTKFDIILLRNLSPTHPFGAHLENASGRGRGVARNHLPAHQRRVKLLRCRLRDVLLP
jgi:hypothetical protein